MSQLTDLPAHAVSIPPHSAPGRLYVRMLASRTDDTHLLVEHPLPTPEDETKLSEQIEAEDRRITFQYLRQHPEAVIYRLVYDGDDGSCVDITILASSDVRAYHKAETGPHEDAEA